MEFECETQFPAKQLVTRQHFFQFVCSCPKGVLDGENFGKLFFCFFRIEPTELPVGGDFSEEKFEI
jgi:hypothetical protein